MIISHEFLVTGDRWEDENNIGYNFVTSLPSDIWLNTKFNSQFQFFGDNSEFNESDILSIYDQKDAVRYLLATAAELNSYSGVDTINTSLRLSVDYRVSFPDVIFAKLNEDSSGKIRLVNHKGETPQSESVAFLPDSNDSLDLVGYVVLNRDYPYLSHLMLGQAGFWLHLHELGHAIGGLEDVKETEQIGGIYDNQKYTMMSYNLYSVTGGGEVYASGLQLLDIAALQETYGTVNTDTRSGNTTYSLGQGLGFHRATANDAFLYTIWDGGGIDTVDASAFHYGGIRGVEIDLREGHFSSLGLNAAGGRGLHPQQRT